MYDLYYFPTPNGHKITMLLEELDVPYKIHTVDIMNGDQHQPEFLKISPNNKMPALVDHEPTDGGEPLALFESGEILLYLAEKYGAFLPEKSRERHQALQWLFWQMASLGPMLGQNHHFFKYAPETIPYAQKRYLKESQRLYAVLDKQLADKPYVCGQYSIVDMACYPWCKHWQDQQIDLKDYPHVRDWVERVGNREATVRAYRWEREYERPDEVSENMRKHLFDNLDD